MIGMNGMINTWMAVREATMAGEPKPWVIMEKWVRWRCMLGSRMGWGRVLQRGDRSWFSRSISSFVINLHRRTDYDRRLRKNKKKNYASVPFAE
jgi:hypothetical protein